MSEFEQQDSKLEAVPFFARYLEGQIDYIEDISEEEMQTVAGGKRFVRHKCASHAKNGGTDGVVVTLKFPSDQEESATQ